MWLGIMTKMVAKGLLPKLRVELVTKDGEWRRSYCKLQQVDCMWALLTHLIFRYIITQIKMLQKKLRLTS